MIGSAVFLLLFLVPLAVGVVLVLRSKERGRGHPTCGGCGYDLSGSASSVARCPECGGAFMQVGIVGSGGARRNRTMLVCGIVLLVLSASCFGTAGIAMLSAQSAMKRAQQQAIAARQAQAAQQQQQEQQRDNAASSAPAPGDLDDAGEE